MLDRIASTPQERATNDWAVIRRLWTYMRDDWRDLLIMLVFLILSAGSQAGGPALIGIAIDRFITEGNSVGLRNAMLWLLVVYVLGFVGFVGQVRILGTRGPAPAQTAAHGHFRARAAAVAQIL